MWTEDITLQAINLAFNYLFVAIMWFILDHRSKERRTTKLHALRSLLWLPVLISILNRYIKEGR